MLFFPVAGILVWFAGIQPPTVLVPTDPYASNTVSSHQIRFNGLRIGATQAEVRATFGEPDRLYTKEPDDIGVEVAWVYGRSEVLFHEDSGYRAHYDIRDARYPVTIGTMTLRVGESAAPLATAFPISWRNRRPIVVGFGSSLNEFMLIGMTDSDISYLLVEIDGDGRIVSIASAVQRV
jgi:hypothetical protein